MVCHGVLACKPGGGLVKLVANQGVGRGWIGGGSGKSLICTTCLGETLLSIFKNMKFLLYKNYSKHKCIFKFLKIYTNINS